MKWFSLLFILIQCLNPNNAIHLKQQNLEGLHNMEKQTSEHRPPKKAVDPEVFMNASQLITSKGLPCEEHTAVTTDGFILGMQRIPRNTPGRYPILLMHGLLGSSDNFLTNLENQSLAYVLHNAGYDVWLGNVRGNHYSRKHKYLNPDHMKFWKWTFDEMSLLDVPAMVDRVLQVTGQRKVTYVGHSQGTLVLFQSVMAHNSSFAEKIHSFFALAPAALVQDLTSPMRKIVPYANDIKTASKLFGKGEFMPASTSLANISRNCRHEPCDNVLEIIRGLDKENTNSSRLPVYFSHNPAGTSTLNMVHWAQMVESPEEVLKYFDFGHWSVNMKHYGQRSPPSLDFSKFTVPAYLFCGGKDKNVSLRNCMQLYSLLPGKKDVFYYDSYTHTDFIWGMDAASRVYSKILDILD